MCIRIDVGRSIGWDQFQNATLLSTGESGQDAEDQQGPDCHSNASWNRHRLLVILEGFQITHRPEECKRTPRGLTSNSSQLRAQLCAATSKRCSILSHPPRNRRSEQLRCSSYVS